MSDASNALVTLGGKRKRGLAVLGAEPTPPAPSTSLLQACTTLAGLDEAATRAMFALPASARLLKTTVSLCPTCLHHVPCAIVDDGGRVLGHKRCATHGASVAVFENDVAFYRLSSRDRSGRSFAPDLVEQTSSDESCCEGGACGPSSSSSSSTRLLPSTPQEENASCTLLLEVTDACNLACRVCYADAKGDRVVPADEVLGHVQAILARRGRLSTVQVTGGEAALHPEFWRIVEGLVDEARIGKVYLPTNGLLLGNDDAVARLARMKDRVLVLVQFDSLREDANRTLRAADPRGARRNLLDRLGAAGVNCQLTMTIARGVNEDDVGAIVDAGLTSPHVKVIALQPVTTSGRYDGDVDPMNRATLSDIVKAVHAQTEATRKKGGFDDEAFVPIPCSHPNCGWITLFFRRSFGPFEVVENLTRHIDLEAERKKLTNKALLSTNELQDVVGSGSAGFADRVKAAIGKRLVRSTDIFTVAIKPFMDKHTYDQDRIATCCHHLMDTHGVETSFCEYNALLRTQDPWTRFPVLPGR